MNQFRMQLYFDLRRQDWSFIKKVYISPGKAMGAFHLIKDSGHFRTFPDISSGDLEVPEKRTTSQSITKFSKISN